MNPRQQRKNQIAKLAASAFARHEITQTLDHGLWRAWRCRRPDQWAYGFDVVTGPGWLMIRGDLGTMSWERTEDMLPWCRGAIRSIDYFAEKVPREFKTEEYDPDMARAWLKDEMHQFWLDHCGCDMDDGEWKHWAELKELRENGDQENQHAWSEQVYSSGVADGCDWPDWNNWTNSFLWLREALKWFLANVKDEALATV